MADPVVELKQKGPRLRVDIDRAHRAKQLIENDLFKAAEEALVKSIADDFNKTSSKDVEALQHLKLKQEVLAEFKIFFYRHVQTGAMSDHELDELKERAKKRH